MANADSLRLRRLPTDTLTDDELAAIRQLMEDAFGTDPEEAFDEDDWQHALGGMHFLLELDGHIVSHASLVPRVLEAGGRPLMTGYVEAMATAPSEQGKGYGSRLMRSLAEIIGDEYELGALATGSVGFYRRLGWQVWQGPTFVRTPAGLERTPGDDGYILVLFTPRTPPLDLTAPLSCDWRPGDVW
jgi:aminoglycoside 2'-N-acetyltransferase I